MANIFDQYENYSQKPAFYGGGRRISRPELSTSGFINVGLETDEPMFRKIKLDLRPPDTVSHMVVRNNHLVLAMANKTIFRIDLKNIDTPDEIEIPVSDKTAGVKIHQLFLDPFGNHLLVSLSGKDGELNSNVLYLLKNLKKTKPCNKMKGHVLTAVAWNLHNKDNGTGPILFGTSKGLIFETELTLGDDRNLFSSNIEVYWKQVFDVRSNITSLELHKYPNSDTDYFVLATTPNRLYQFLGKTLLGAEPPVLQSLFNNYNNDTMRFYELPCDLEYSQLQLYQKTVHDCPCLMAWMTGAGIYHGSIDCSGKLGKDSVTKDTGLIYYPDEDARVRPIAITLLEFHAIILFQDRLKVICLLNEEMVFLDIFAEIHGKMVGLVKDIVTGKIYAYSERAVFTYIITNEARNVWQIYLDKGDYASAEFHSQNNPVNLDKVRTQQAEQLFNKQKFDESARLYAKTQASFEQVSLKFLAIEETMALKHFLSEKLTSLKAHEKTQITMIVTWIMELYLNQLGILRDTGDKISEKYTALIDEFYSFLEKQKVTDCINNNKNVVYNLISSHGDQETLIHVAFLMKDYERLISYQIDNRNFCEALKILEKYKNPELFYQYSPVLMQSCPKETVGIWISQGRRLNPTKLIPALLQCDQGKNKSQEAEAIRYFEFCVNTLDNKDTSIHNYLLSLYAKLDSEKLMTYLTLQGQDPVYICYDLKYALRVCSEYKHVKACVLIYAAMGLYEEAVDLALKVDVQLAKQNADRPEDDDELRKKLWLKIAKHVVKEENNIKKAMEFLKECNLIKIEDILPFFPDFVTIDHFKEAICSSLKEYNQHIDILQDEMKDATESAQEIRAEIQAFRNRQIYSYFIHFLN
uniref:Pep3/Vps18 beta-propeller domain-containing protein n=1 Tax=Strigamia maritima TaxID=126957 RepID=T1JMS9_STRMM